VKEGQAKQQRPEEGWSGVPAFAAKTQKTATTFDLLV
jgi:hypothetical protein